MAAAIAAACAIQELWLVPILTAAISDLADPLQDSGE